MSARVDDGIPPITGCLESIHGHHNESTPKHNTFWASMYRLATQIVRSVEGYSARIRHNFNRAVRVSRDFASKAGPEMQDQIRFFGSTQDLCP
jgi:hypothetical protein